MKLIFHGDFAERDWIEWLFADLADGSIRADKFAASDSPAIHVVGANAMHGRRLSADVARLSGAGHDTTLFHVSDEWLAGGYRQYRHFDRVIRTYASGLVAAPGIATVPLGYPNGGAGPAVPRPAGERTHRWSFAGEIKASRAAMVAALAGVPGAVHDTRTGAPLARGDYRALLADSVFLPCPMGNVVLETWRLYEALEQGCIPIVEARPTIDYWRRLFGDHPIPTVRDWHEAPALIARLAPEATALQARVHGWWATHKRVLRDRMAAFMREDHATDLARFADRWRVRHPMTHQALRLTELARHQNFASLRARISRAV